MWWERKRPTTRRLHLRRFVFGSSRAGQRGAIENGYSTRDQVSGLTTDRLREPDESLCQRSAVRSGRPAEGRLRAPVHARGACQGATRTGPGGECDRTGEMSTARCVVYPQGLSLVALQGLVEQGWDECQSARLHAVA